MQESAIIAQNSLRLVVWDIHEPRLIVTPPFIDMQGVHFPTYMQDPSNEHHWKFDYVWNTVMPYISKKLGISFNPLDFIHIDTTNTEYSRHLWHSDFKCVAYCFKTNKVEVFTYKDCCCGGGISQYHNIIRYPHESILYTIDSPIQSNRTLLVNSDSMAIPLVPLLLPYYSKILFVDFRWPTKDNDRDMIDRFEFTDYLCLLIAGSYKHNIHLHNLTDGYIPPSKLTFRSKPTRHSRIMAKLQSIRKHH